MWEEQKRARFQELRRRHDESVLTEVERAELASLIEELDAAESAYLTPATQRLQQEREVLESQNRALAILVRRKEAMVQRRRDLRSLYGGE